MDPALVGPDPVWQSIKQGKGHIYVALAIIVVLAVVIAPAAPRSAALIAALAGGVFSDCWSHLVCH